MFRITGTIVDILTTQGTSKKGNPYSIFHYVIETDEEYRNQTVCLNYWGEEAEFKKGTYVSVEFYIKSTQFKDRYYTELVVSDMQQIKKETEAKTNEKTDTSVTKTRKPHKLDFDDAIPF